MGYAVVSAHKGAPTTPRKVVPSLPACEFACNGPRRHEGPQGATPRTRSACATPEWTAGLGWMENPTQPRTLVPANLPKEAHPRRGLSEVVPQASTPQHFRVFVPRRSALVGIHPVPKHTAPAPVHRRGTHSGGCPGWPSQFWVQPGWK